MDAETGKSIGEMLVAAEAVLTETRKTEEFHSQFSSPTGAPVVPSCG